MFHQTGKLGDGKIPFEQDDMSHIRGNHIEGILILIRHSNQSFEVPILIGIIHIVILVGDDLIEVGFQVQFLGVDTF